MLYSIKYVILYRYIPVYKEIYIAEYMHKLYVEK